MARKSLKLFNPDKVAVLESRTWHAYYKHRFVKMFLLLVKTMGEFYQLDYVRSIQAAYLITLALIDFRLNKGKEDYNRVLKKITDFARLIRKHSLEEFDYEMAAKKETEWWFVDRYPQRYEIPRELAIANAAATWFNTGPDKLKQYAEYRARAMVMQDEAELQKREADWNKIELLLKQSYKSLKEAI